nr:hypothetical protein [Stenotrophomonas pavanii]
MTTDKKTLADVQPGGRVRLGDSRSTRAATFLRQYLTYLRSSPRQGLRPRWCDVYEALEITIESLSAQPSPGGKPDVLAALVEACEDMRAASEECDNGEGLAHVVPYHQWNEFLAKLDDADQALSARQPVATLIHPHSGQPRDYRDVNSDPEGFLCVPAGPIFAAQPSPGGQDALAEAARRVISDIDSGDYHGEISEATYAALEDALAAHQPAGRSFQAGVAEWMGQCFLPSLYSNMTERGDRLLEEVLELLQAHGYDKARVPTLVDYVFGRPVGDPAQEVGGVMVTLAGYCWVAGLDMHAAGDAELARINQPDVMAKIQAKQEAKNALHFDTPLPGNAAEPAQAVDLGQFREHVARSRHMLMQGVVGLKGADREDIWKCIQDSDRLLALIDSQAVSNG